MSAELNQLIRNLPDKDYHAHPAISKSGLAEFQRSPAHYRHWRDNDKPDTDALRLGRAFHTMLLEPDTFDARVYVWAGSERKTKAGKQAYKDAVAAAGTRLMLKKTEHDNLKAIAESISSHVSARVILSGRGDVEATLLWTDEETGVECRARPDWLRSDGVLVDLKTTTDARVHKFQQDAYKYLYHWQAAMYCDGYEAVTGQKAQGFFFVAAEKEAPHGVSVMQADEGFIALGRQQYREALARFAEQQKKNHWPKYEDALLQISLPAWVERKLEHGEVLYV